MRKKVFITMVGALAVLLAALIVSGTLSATTYTFTYGTSKLVTVPNGYLYRFQWQGTGVKQTDTLIINLPPTQPQKAISPDTTLYYVNVFTSDSAVIGVRYSISSDNTTWKSYTIGTDSTTWYPGAYDAGTTIAMNTFVISTGQYGGVQPYTRLKIVNVNPYSRTLYGWVGKIKVDVIPVHQQ
jgi:hypothetical protein